MQTLIQDLRYGARMLRKQPGFTLIAVLTLSLGIGANTAIFSLVNTALLRPLLVAQPEQLVALNSVSLDGQRNFPTFSFPNYRDLRDRNDVLTGLAAYRLTPVSLSNHGVNVRLWGTLVTGNYFELLGITPARGRLFTPDDDRLPGAHALVVLSHDCWQQRFGADPDIAGQQVLVNGQRFTVIGVAPAGFHGTEVSFHAEMWFPAMMLAQIEPGRDYLNDRESFNFFVIGRRRPDVTTAQAEAALNNVMAQLARAFPKANEGLTIALSPPGLFGLFLRGPVLGFVGVLMLVAGLVLLLACTNLANLLLARATGRRREIAVRLALGAGRWRLIRLLLTESILLSVLGGGLGLWLAYWLMDAVMAFKPPMDVPLVLDLHLDYRVLLFTAAASMLTGVLFGLLPALQATKTDLVPALKGEAGVGGARRSWLRNGLIVLQTALSLTLLVCAGLVLRGLQNARHLNPGMVTQNAVKISFDLELQGYDEGRVRQFKQQLLARVRALPGVEAAGLTNFVPLSLSIRHESIQVEGQPEQKGGTAPVVMASDCSPGTLAALGTRLLQGRDFTDADGESGPRVAIVNETFAQRFWPQQSALGKRFSLDGLAGPWIEIVGVMQQGRYFSLSEADRPFFYANLRPRSGSFLTLVVRRSGDAPGLIAALRREFQQLDATLPLDEVKTLAEHINGSLFPARVAALLLGSFGLLALLLAAIGLFGVMSYAVSQRTHEIGIRLALGASSRQIVRLIVSHGLKLTALGIALGLALALAVTRLLSVVLFGISATDALVLAGVATLLLLVALLACWLPAWRATKVDPLIALRHE